MLRYVLVFYCALLSTAAAWDPVGDVKKGKVFSNIGRETGRITDQARTDVSNGLNRIDPRITQMGRDFDRARLEFQTSVFSGPALEQWFVASRNSAVANAMPMPPFIRQALTGWFDASLFDLVRFKVGDGGALNLANNSIRVGSAEAVTLIDVIIFKGPSEAQRPDLWAHEMMHIQQFRDWGVRNFSIRYMRSWNGVENPAYEIQNRYNQSGGRPSVAQAPQQAPYQLQMPQSLARGCMTQLGMCGLMGPTARGTNCACAGQFGPVYGVAN